MEKQTFNDLQAIETRIPDWIIKSVNKHENIDELLEIVMDLGRPPEARFLHSSYQLGETEITSNDIDHVIKNISEFSGYDNIIEYLKTTQSDHLSSELKVHLLSK